MTRKSDPTHCWLGWVRAQEAAVGYLLRGIEETGISFTDFRILEVLLHKGPLPVNVIGPKVNLTPGAISVAVDRLLAKGFVSRTESAEDRRVRVVALTVRGKAVITPIFRMHAETLEEIFSPLTRQELRQLEQQLKRVGKQ